MCLTWSVNLPHLESDKIAFEMWKTGHVLFRGIWIERGQTKKNCFIVKKCPRVPFGYNFVWFYQTIVVSFPADVKHPWIFFSLSSIFISLCSLIGLRCIHLHLLCIGDGGKDGGSWDLWPTLLPGRHLEQAGLLHCHGWVSNCFIMLTLILLLGKFVCCVV